MRGRLANKRNAKQVAQNLTVGNLPKDRLSGCRFELEVPKGEPRKGVMGKPRPAGPIVEFVCEKGKLIVAFAPSDGTVRRKGKDLIVSLTNGKVLTARNVYGAR